MLRFRSRGAVHLAARAGAARRVPGGGWYITGLGSLCWALASTALALAIAALSRADSASGPGEPLRERLLFVLAIVAVGARLWIGSVTHCVERALLLRSRNRAPAAPPAIEIGRCDGSGAAAQASAGEAAFQLGAAARPAAGTSRNSSTESSNA